MFMMILTAIDMIAAHRHSASGNHLAYMRRWAVRRENLRAQRPAGTLLGGIRFHRLNCIEYDLLEYRQIFNVALAA
jgi:hypothetical protein